MNKEFERDFDEESNTEPTLDDALHEMQSNAGSLPGPEIMYGLSSLTDTEIEKLLPIWDSLDTTYRLVLMQMFVDVSETNYELNYEAIGRANLNAEQPEIRKAALEVLWEDNSPSLMNELLSMVQNDDSADVQAEAARSLGRFVLLGELGNLPDSTTKPAEDVLFDILADESTPLAVRGPALESLANCSREGIASLIHDAYRSADIQLRASAIIAMGRSCEEERWGSTVLEELENPDSSFLHEAVRAAGELQLRQAVPALIAALESAERELQETVIWAMSEIGGEAVMPVLTALATEAEQAQDEELLELIEDALGNASLSSDDFTLMDFSNLDGIERNN